MLRPAPGGSLGSRLTGVAETSKNMIGVSFTDPCFAIAGFLVVCEHVLTDLFTDFCDGMGTKTLQIRTKVVQVAMHEKIKKKDPKHIYAYEEMSEIRFSTHLPQPNNLCSIMVDQLETWLQFVLNWDPQQRGGGMDNHTGSPHCFVLMDHILNLKALPTSGVFLEMMFT
ncbi:unnamed protein product [Ranitomeya imitator]|uniref:Uncharacterized protein n=1 Tax=Ranitomeya imitator TaxID=111125 RepID=A0ABN9M6P0_9NEOB|nr:unnamed protein product [Ranitomeya imitator]